MCNRLITKGQHGTLKTMSTGSPVSKRSESQHNILTLTRFAPRIFFRPRWEAVHKLYWHTMSTNDATVTTWPGVVSGRPNRVRSPSCTTLTRSVDKHWNCYHWVREWAGYAYQWRNHSNHCNIYMPLDNWHCDWWWSCENWWGIC